MTMAVTAGALMAGVLLAGPAGAQQAATQPAAASQPAPGPRVAEPVTQSTTPPADIIITPRDFPNPDENDAFHQAEYERLNAIYGKPVPLNTRVGTLMDVPQGKLPQDRSALRAIIADPDTPHLIQVLSPESK
ncbi:hypothetical protein [Nitrospirillum sp. BR 11828]|uniref:hypothetical protein n=1 Tax=Nitrospirillum sp. BR 11828 TaxID=3104325 RepID=UPI002ACA9C05|nr:hypothetical protein [Nitrospirillum sp. BR 11828]MDZ5646918.1 hypothetical protein [Nitrospirillum sp. BR 11828]